MEIIIYNKGNIINVVGNNNFIDFYVKIEIIKIIDFNEIEKYHKEFKDLWFDTEENLYQYYKKNIKKVYVGKLLKNSQAGKVGEIIAFAEGFIDIERTTLLK